MTAIKTGQKLAKNQPDRETTSHLRVLSKNQRQQVATITNDWENFTSSVFDKMFHKI